MLETPSAPGISNLVQQLRSGEISKLQLFERISTLKKLTEENAFGDQLRSKAPVAASPQRTDISAPFEYKDQEGFREPKYDGTSASSYQYESYIDSASKQPQTDNHIEAVSGNVYCLQDWLASRKEVSAVMTHPIPSSITTEMQKWTDEVRTEDSFEREESDQDKNVHRQRMSSYTHNPPHYLDTFAESDTQSLQSKPSSDHSEYAQHTDALFRHSDKGFQALLHPQEQYNMSSPCESTRNQKNPAPTNTAFHARVMRWQSKKEAQSEQMKERLLQTELEKCTFAPHINAQSLKAAARARIRRGISTLDMPEPRHSASIRLYMEFDNFKEREELASRAKAEQEEKIQQDCTFKPKIAKTRYAESARPKYMDKPVPSAATYMMAEDVKRREMEECTFQPKVNPIGPEMVSAQLYLQKNIFQRLNCPGSDTDDRGYLNGNTEVFHGYKGIEHGDLFAAYGSDSEGNELVQRRGAICSQDDFNIGIRRKHGSRQTSLYTREGGFGAEGNETVSKALMHGNGGRLNPKFQIFMQRQQIYEHARQKRLEQKRQQLELDHKPTINKRSGQMMASGQKGDYLARVSMVRHGSTKQKKYASLFETNCTFQPRINDRSAKRIARSVTDLSRGDLLRRETTRRLIKLKIEQEQMASLTFRPRLNRISNKSEGKLRILTNAETYIQRIQYQLHAAKTKQRCALQMKEIEEIAACTFKPKIIPAPAYVRRIAKSSATMRAHKKEQTKLQKQEQEKPDWK